MSTSVSEHMTNHIISISIDSKIKDVCEVLFEEDISSIVVKDGEDIVGIVTDRDLVRYELFDEKPETVEGLMSTNLITIESDADIIDAVRLMKSYMIRHLLVTREFEPVGMLSFRDILKIEGDRIQGYITEEGYGSCVID
jgi:CBS domain-containing protein